MYPFPGPKNKKTKKIRFPPPSIPLQAQAGIRSLKHQCKPRDSSVVMIRQQMRSEIPLAS